MSLVLFEKYPVGLCKTLVTATTLLVLTACSSVPEDVSDIEVDPDQQQRKLYCDTGFGYDMCAQDLNGDGRSDLLYFDDTKEVFVFWESTRELIPGYLVMHECAQPMELSMRKATTDLLYFPEDLGTIGRLRLRGGLLLAYTKYSGYVDECYEPDENDTVPVPGEDDYGEFASEDFEEFGDEEFEREEFETEEL